MDNNGLPARLGALDESHCPSGFTAVNVRQQFLPRASQVDQVTEVLEAGQTTAQKTVPRAEVPTQPAAKRRKVGFFGSDEFAKIVEENRSPKILALHKNHTDKRNPDAFLETYRGQNADLSPRNTPVVLSQKYEMENKHSGQPPASHQEAEGRYAAVISDINRAEESDYSLDGSIEDEDMIEAITQMTCQSESAFEERRKTLPLLDTTSTQSQAAQDISTSFQSSSESVMKEPWDDHFFDEEFNMSLLQPMAALTASFQPRPCEKSAVESAKLEEWDSLEEEEERDFFDLVKIDDAQPKSKDYSKARFEGDSEDVANAGALDPPSAVRDRSWIVGMSSEILLRVCFKIDEALQYGCDAARRDNVVIIELYARVRSSQREGSVQSFVLGNLHDDDPPFLEADYSSWKGIDLFDFDSKCFLEAQGDGMLCRCVGRIVRRASAWILEVSSIWQADWDDVRHVEGIARMQRLTYGT